MYLKYIIVLVLLVFWEQGAKADKPEKIVTNPATSALDKRYDYPMALLKLVLERTKDKYGPYEIERFPEQISRKRALYELQISHIDVFSAPSQPEWENTLVPIRIPIRKGILGYKLLLIREQDQEKFAQVQNLNDLKAYRFGGGQQWSASRAMKELGIHNYGGLEYEALFPMLNGNRFDYFPRGVNEIFSEYDLRHEKYPNLVIEKNLAIYLPQPTYFFVTPLKPELVKRVKEGLILLIRDGSLDQLFQNYYADNLKRADLASRRIIKLENKLLSKETPFLQENFWYSPASER